MVKYKKVGGIHFVRVLRFGFNFYWTRKPVQLVSLPEAALKDARLISIKLANGQRVLRLV